jgi:hypothetical protein
MEEVMEKIKAKHYIEVNMRRSELFLRNKEKYFPLLFIALISDLITQMDI